MKNLIIEYKENEKLIESISLNTYDLIKKLLSKEKIQSFTYRIKNIESLEKKINSKKKYDYLNEVTDIIGFRVITYLNSDVDKIFTIINENFVIDNKNTVDKRNLHYNEFGYRSLHVVFSYNEKRISLPEYVNCNKYKYEMQIRTVLQHAWAEIEHDLGYKTELQIPDEYKRTFYKISMLLEYADDEFEKITKQIKLYKNNVEKKFKDEKFDLPLNRETLRSYLLENKNIEEINNNIKLNGYNYLEIKTIDAIDFAFAVDKLIFVGVDSIDKLNNKIEIYKNILPACIDVFLQELEGQNRKDGRFEWSVPIFYLINIILSEKDNDFRINFFKKFNLIDQDQTIIKGLDGIKKVLKEHNF